MPQPDKKYEEIPKWDRAEVERAVRENNPNELLYAVVAVSMHDKDWRYAQDLCVKLSSHSHFNVRGNALLGFGHIARVHRKLDSSIVQPIIQAALKDSDKYVRGHAWDAADDTSHFLGWHYDRN